MAIIEQELYSLLSTSTLVTTIASNRIYPVFLPQAVKFPAIAYERSASDPVNSIDGYSGLNNPSIEIDAYATSYLTCRTLADNIRSVLDGAGAFKSVWVTDRDFGFVDAETNKNLYRVTREYSMWNKE